MDKSFGFNLNTSMVIDKDGKTSCGVSYKDSEGYNFRKDKKGEDASSVLTDLVNDFVGGYTEHLINTKAAEKSKEVADSATEKQEEKPEPQVSDALTKRLRELEEENRRLRIEYETKIDLDEIEDYAKNILGMQRAGESRTEKIDTDTQDKAILIERIS